jgi:pseudouridine-5'-phosphate glycosidase
MGKDRLGDSITGSGGSGGARGGSAGEGDNFSQRLTEFLTVSGEISQALAQSKPVVALESTIISHGMPYPQNVAVAREVEQVIRDQGAIPATIAILGGHIKVGLTDAELEFLGKAGPRVAKVSRRDFGPVLATKRDGATTVAGTMIVAHLAGISVFATGGIGGVHRGGAASLDVSADLDELGQTPVLVVCAGAKAILDLNLTMEYLETKGVPVYGYQTDQLPAFYTSASGIALEYRFDQTAPIAAAFAASRALGLATGAVVAAPIPEQFSMPAATINQAIDQAVEQAQAAGIRGQAVTPFLLATVKDLTGGDSLAANIALVKNNARIAAQIAVDLA